MIDIKSISQDQRKYKNRTPNDLNIKLIAIMVNFLFQYRWWAFPFAHFFEELYLRLKTVKMVFLFSFKNLFV